MFFRASQFFMQSNANHPTIIAMIHVNGLCQIEGSFFTSIIEADSAGKFHNHRLHLIASINSRFSSFSILLNDLPLNPDRSIDKLGNLASI